MHSRGLSSVNPDNLRGGYLATQHLLRCGRKRIAEGKSVTPAFLFATLLWGAVRAQVEREIAKGTEPALASSWKVSPDGRKYTLALRRDVKFSDGAPFTADDVIFTLQLYLDESLSSPQRDLLVIDNKPIAVKKIDNYTVEFDLTKPYGPGERIFDIDDNVFKVSSRINSTWGGNLTDMVRSRRQLEVIAEEGLFDRAAVLGKRLLDDLRAVPEKMVGPADPRGG